MVRSGSAGLSRAVAWWRTAALLVSCAGVVACGGRALIGSLACGESDAGGQSGDASDLACSPPSCFITGAWQAGGAEVACLNGACWQVLPSCRPGAIRFDPSGALFRLTSAGWEGVCTYRTCGDRVTGSQLSNILGASSSSVAPTACGPDWDLFIIAGSLDAGPGGIATCTLNAYAPCAGDGTRTDGPPGVAPWSVEVAYSQCAP